MKWNKNMENIKKYFYDNILLKKEDEERAKKYLQSKGVESHIEIMEYLKEDNNKVRYEKIATAFRYNKRLIRVVNIFISYLEDFYRGLLQDKFSDNVDLLNPDVFLSNKIREKGNLRDALEEIHFSSLIDYVKKTRMYFNDLTIFPSEENIDDNISCINSLRNSVMHSKMLLTYYVKNNKEPWTLKEVIVNLIKLLPIDLREKCAKRINDCSIEGEHENHTTWDLSPKYLINIEKKDYKII